MIDPDLPYLQIVRQEKQYLYEYQVIEVREMVRLWWRSSDDRCYSQEYSSAGRRNKNGKLTPSRRNPSDVDSDRFQAIISGLVAAGALTFVPGEEYKGIPHDFEIKVESGACNSFPLYVALRDEAFRKVFYGKPG